MKSRLSCAAALLFPLSAFAGDVVASGAMIPLSPPGVMAHAAFFTLTNNGHTHRRLIGVSAEGYAMAHIHRSEDIDGIATMSAIDEIAIAPGQDVAFTQGGLHLMLMRPTTPQRPGGSVTLSLSFANGEVLSVPAQVQRMDHGS